jgi:leader peptidase (prepilin peptidase)/N-methyltransferase
MDFTALLFIFLFGLAFGSFMNVLIMRIPAGESLLSASHCPLCGAKIAWFSNIPILSYILQRGKCKSCAGRISAMYPVVELLTACLFCLIFLQTDSTILAIKYCCLAFILLAAALTDVRTRLIPDVYTFGGVLCGYVWAICTELNPELRTEPHFLYALAGSGAGYFMIMIPSFVYTAIRKREGIGEGDALLLAMVGSFVGVEALPLILLISALAGIVVGAVMIARTRDRYYKIPFAPMIAVGSMVWIIISF